MVEYFSSQYRFGGDIYALVRQVLTRLIFFDNEKYFSKGYKSPLAMARPKVGVGYEILM